jgi:hypothetical protein
VLDIEDLPCDDTHSTGTIWKAKAIKNVERSDQFEKRKKN